MEAILPRSVNKSLHNTITSHFEVDITVLIGGCASTISFSEVSHEVSHAPSPRVHQPGTFYGTSEHNVMLKLLILIGLYSTGPANSWGVTSAATETPPGLGLSLWPC